MDTNSRPNRFLLGSILIILGVYMFLNSRFQVSYGSLPFVVGGCVLILLYYTKQKTWALVLGAIILAFSLVGFVGQIPVIGPYISGAFSFIVPGLLFISMYYQRGNATLLIPGCILFWIGISSVLTHFSVINDFVNVFIMCIGLAFLSMYVLGRRQVGKWTLYLGLLMVAGSIGLLSGRYNVLGFFRFFPGLMWILMIVMGLYLIFKSRNTQ